MRDFTGTTNAEKIGFLTNLANNGDTNKIKLGFTVDTFTAFVASVAALVTARTDADAAVAAGQAAVNAFGGQLDALIAQSRNAANSGRASTMTDDELAALGISRRSTVPTPVPAPTVAPILAVDSLTGGSARLAISNPTGGKAKPAGAATVEVSLRGSEAVTSPDAGVMTRGSRTPLVVDTTLLAAGRVKAVARYVTAKGLKGPWSAPIEFNSQTV